MGTRLLPRIGPLTLLLTALPLAATAAPPTQIAATPWPRERLRHLEAAISAEMSRQQIPGLSVAIARGGEVRFAEAYGLADIENFVPVREETVFRLASISKVITATAVLQLAERGSLDLDVPIQKYVPAFPEKPWPITARQLLCHQGGIRHYAEGEMTSTRRYGNLTDALQPFKDSPLIAEPGTKAQYSSYGYNLLGAAVEGASGVGFVDFLRRNVFERAGMTRTQPDDLFEIIPGRAAGYFKDDAGRHRNSAWADTSGRIPGGGLCGTATDVALFGAAYLEGALVKPETVQRMLTRQKTRDGKLTGYGLGWILGERMRRREAWCTGAQPKVSGTLYLNPDAGVAVAILCNLESIQNPLTALARQLADIAAR